MLLNREACLGAMGARTVLMDGLAPWLRHRTSSCPSSVPRAAPHRRQGRAFPPFPGNVRWIAVYLTRSEDGSPHPCLLVGGEMPALVSLSQGRVSGPAAGHSSGNLVPQALARLTQHSVCAEALGCIPSSALQSSLVGEEMGPQRGWVTWPRRTAGQGRLREELRAVRQLRVVPSTVSTSSRHGNNKSKYA